MHSRFKAESFFTGKNIAASKELAVKGTVKSAGTFYHTGWKLIIERLKQRTIDKR